MVSGGGERQLLLRLLVDAAEAQAQISAYNDAGKQTVTTNASIASSTDTARMSLAQYATMVGGATTQNQAYAEQNRSFATSQAEQSAATKDLTLDFQALVSAQRETAAAQAQVAQATEAAMSGQLSEAQSTTLLSSAFTRLSAAQVDQSAAAKAVVADSTAMGGSFATTTVQANALAASVTTESSANDMAAGSSGRLTAALGTVGLALAAVTVASGAFAVKEAADFQGTTTDIANFGNITVAQADAIGQGLDHNFNLGTASSASLREALSQNIGVLEQVVGGTLNAAQANQVLTASQNLAMVGNQNLDATTKAVSTTLRTFNLDVTDAAHVSDLLFNSQTKTGQSSEQTAAAWGRMKEMLGVLNPSIEDVAALTDRASEAGLNGTRAIQGLASGWDHLFSQSPSVLSALKEYGISLYDNTGKARGFDDVGAEYIARQAGMTDAQKVAMDAALMGGQAFQKNWDILAAGQTPLQMVHAELGGIADVSDIATSKSGTLQGQWEQLKAAGADLAITVGVTLIDAFANLIKYEDETIIKTGNFMTEIGTWQTGITAVDNELKKLGGQMQEYGKNDLAQTTEFQKQFNNAVEASTYPTDALSTHLSQGGDGLHKYGAEAVAAGAGVNVVAESAKNAQKAFEEETKAQQADKEGKHDLAVAERDLEAAYNSNDPTRIQNAQREVALATTTATLAVSDATKAYGEETKAQQADLEGKTGLAAAERELAAAYTSGIEANIQKAQRDVALATTTTSQLRTEGRTQVSDANTAANDLRTASELTVKGKQEEAAGYTQAAELERQGDVQGAKDAIAAGKERQTAADETAKAVTTANKNMASDVRASNAELFSYIKTETMALPTSWRQGLAGAEAAVQQASAAILADDQALASGLQGDALKTMQAKRQTDSESLASAKQTYTEEAAAAQSMEKGIQEAAKASLEYAKALRAEDLTDTITKNQQKLASELNTIQQSEQAQRAAAATGTQVAQITAQMYMTEAAQAKDSATRQKDEIEAGLVTQVAAIKQAESDKIAAIQTGEQQQLVSENRALLAAQEQKSHADAEQLKIQAQIDANKAQIDIDLAEIEISLLESVTKATSDNAQQVLGIESDKAQATVDIAQTSGTGQMSVMDTVQRKAGDMANTIWVAVGNGWQAGVEGSYKFKSNAEMNMILTGKAAITTGEVIGSGLSAGFSQAETAATTSTNTAISGLEGEIRKLGETNVALEQSKEGWISAGETAVNSQATVQSAIDKTKTDATNSIASITQAAEKQLAILQASAAATMGTIQDAGQAAGASSAGASSAGISSGVPSDLKSLGLGTGGSGMSFGAPNWAQSAIDALGGAQTTALQNQNAEIGLQNSGLTDQIALQKQQLDQAQQFVADQQATLSVMNDQTNVLTEQLNIANEQLDVNGQTSKTDATLLGLEVQRDKLVLAGQATTEVDKQIAQENNKNKLAADQVALADVGLSQQEAAAKIQADQAKMVLDQVKAQDEYTQSVRDSIKALTDERSVLAAIAGGNSAQITADKLGVGGSVGSSSGSSSGLTSGASGGSTSGFNPNFGSISDYAFLSSIGPQNTGLANGQFAGGLVGNRQTNVDGYEAVVTDRDGNVWGWKGGVNGQWVALATAAQAAKARAVPGYALGGTSSGGFAMVGERGPEIVSLPRGAEVIPNHAISHFAEGTPSFGSLWDNSSSQQTNVLQQILYLLQRGIPVAATVVNPGGVSGMAGQGQYAAVAMTGGQTGFQY